MNRKSRFILNNTFCIFLNTMALRVLSRIQSTSNSWIYKRHDKLIYSVYVIITILSMTKTREISIELDTYGWVSIGPRSISQIILLFFVYTKNYDIKIFKNDIYILIALWDHLGFEFAAKNEQSLLAGWGILIILTTIAIFSL